jgi:hypothetical protein
MPPMVPAPGTSPVHADARERCDFEKIRTFVEECFQTFAREQLAARFVALHILRAAAFGRPSKSRAQLLDLRGHGDVVGAIGIRLPVNIRGELQIISE